ncbi:DUF427 domain-containing protein [Nocardia otitidiscaviarum]|uniref:DUF427 domain-containing protein n=1 Tax=Nocardia otitidiscaviarum TaxID=1823 RepID=A0A516NT76_9NOCA|nr:DUF427 domain-containing protein [Nocardia otitidiscaviarum]MCP9621415.1 DUF427 domain-containing protein [Nocardia otitidiscaviarum]QDP82113.1 DUF427 domain-containing protein [Nocardia otitidiscaviarum]
MSETNRSGVRVEPCAKRVRTYLGGHLVADTRHPVLVWEHPHYPTYYLPAADLTAKLEPSGDARGSTELGDGTAFDVLADNATAFGAAVRYLDSPVPELRELVRLDFDAMDAWFEEDEPIYVHPRDPYSRVDVLASSRHIRVDIDGTTVADSRNPRILFETGLPARYYLPMTDVRMDLLRESDTTSQCPYKGTASYWTVRIGEREYPDIVWGYPTPLPESQKVAGLVCFYNEKVDIWVDGELQARPASPFS